MGYSRQELEDALPAVKSITAKCEKALPGQKEGSPQRTLLTRRIKAMRISAYLIENEMEKKINGDMRNTARVMNARAMRFWPPGTG